MKKGTDMQDELFDAGTLAEEPKKKAILRDIVVEQIRDLIKSEHLQPGRRLPPERALATRFAVSRHLVREALRVLEQQQVIVSRIGSGSYVESPDAAWQNFLTEDTLRQRSNLMEILEFRRTLEPRIAYLAANRVTPKAGTELRALLGDMRVALHEGRTDDWHAGDAAFHSYLAGMAGNFLYEKTVSLLLQAMVVFKTSPLLIDQIRTSQAAHEAIAGYIFTRNGEKAAEAMEEHVVTIVRTALNSLSGNA